jgi:hypothetical protein
MLTVTHLRAEHLWLGWLPGLRVALLGAGCLGSLWLAFQISSGSTAENGKKWLAGAAMMLPVTLMAPYGRWFSSSGKTFPKPDAARSLSVSRRERAAMVT